MLTASSFALNQQNVLVENFHLLKAQPNHPKQPLYFLKGDPTAYGNKQCKMSEKGYEIMRQSIDEPDNHSYCHSAGTQEARQAIAKHFKHNSDITFNDVIITSGVNQCLLYALWACCDAGSNILVPELGYPFYDGIAPSYEVELHKYKLKLDQNCEVDFKSLDSLLDDNTSFLYIINPSNPCGSVFSKKHIQQIIHWAQDNSVLLIVDETYFGMTFGEFHSFGELAEDGPIICLNGMDKMFFVPGWQTSWIIFYDRCQIAADIKNSFFNIILLLLHSNVFIMSALPQLLNELTPYYAQQGCQIFKQNHDYLIAQLETIPGLHFIPAQGTYYLVMIVDLQQYDLSDDTQLALLLLEEQNLMFLPLSWIGSGKYQGLRILTLANLNVYREVVIRMREFFEKHLKQVDQLLSE